MTEYIGQITVIVEAEEPEQAKDRLRFLAKQLDDGFLDVVFSDHNGDIEDYDQIERECDESFAQQDEMPTRFDDYEIGPCLRLREDGERDRFYYETCKPEEADVWTLYGHIPGQGVEAIGDFATRERAEEVYARITGRRYGRGA